MSILFDDTNPDYLTLASAPVTIMPMTFSLWIYPDEDGRSFQAPFSIGNSGGVDQFTINIMGGTVNDPVRCYARDAGGQTFATINGIVFNTWQHVAATYINNVSRYVFLDGVKSAQDVNDRTPANINLTRVAIEARSGAAASKFSGRIAEIGVWNVTLTDDEITILSLGYSPLFVRPESLVFYLPLIRDNDNDLIGGLHLTAGGSPTISAHPRIRYPANPYIPYIITAGGTTYSGTITDGLEFSDANAGLLTAIRSMSDGLKLSDTKNGNITVIGNLVDGFELSDSKSGNLILTGTIIDGVKLSDSDSSIVIFQATITDGIKLSDAVASIASYLATISNGIILSDSITSIETLTNGSVRIELTLKMSIINDNEKLSNITEQSKISNISEEVQLENE